MLDFLKSSRIVLLLLALLVAVNYGLTINNGYMIDDEIFLQGMAQTAYSSYGEFFTKADGSHYSPLYWLVNFALFDHFSQTPAVISLFSWLCFYLSVVLFYTLLLVVFKSRGIALLAAVLMVLHPVHHFTVTYKTANFVLFAAVFMQLTLLFEWLIAQGSRQRRWLQILAYVFFVLALLSTEWAALLPFYIGILLCVAGKKSVRQTLMALLPYVFMDALFVVLYMKVAAANMGLLSKIQSVDLSILDYFGSVGYFAFLYVGNLSLFKPIVFMANLSEPVAHSLAWAIGLMTVLAGIVYLVFFRWKKNAKSFALLWLVAGFGLVLLAMFSHAYMGLMFEPHWMFFASFGFFMLVAIYLNELRLRMPSKIFVTGMLVLAVGLLGVTQFYNRLTQSERVYCEYLLSHYPDNRIALSTLANNYLNSGEDQLAIPLYQHVIALGDGDLYKEFSNLGLIYTRMGQFDEAEAYLQTAIQLNPNFAIAHHNLGGLALQQGQIDSAIAHYQNAMTLDPDRPEVRLTLISALIQDDDVRGALEVIDAADFRGVPQFYQREILIKKAVVLAKAQRLKLLQQTLADLYAQFNDADTYWTMSQNLLAINQTQLAIQNLDAALLKFPRQPELYLLYGSVLGNQAQWDQAIVMLKRGAALDANDTRFPPMINKARRLQVESAAPVAR